MDYKLVSTLLLVPLPMDLLNIILDYLCAVRVQLRPEDKIFIK